MPEFTVADITNRDLVTVSEEESTERAARLMRERFISGAPVVDVKDRIVGVVSLRDLVGRPPTEMARNVMTPLVFSIDGSAPMRIAAQLMVDSRLHRLFVEEAGQVIGLVTLTDIVRLVGEFGLNTASRPAEDPVELWNVIKVDKPRDAFLASLKRCETHLARTFYRRFTASSPAVRAMFAGTDTETQEGKILKALRLAADVISGDARALSELTQQAQRHDRHHLGVTREMYDLWLEALVNAVAECDPLFNRGVEHAWRLLMGHVVHHMTRRY